MEQSLKSSHSSARQEIHCILWKPNVHYHIQKSPPRVPIQSHTNQDHTLPTDFVVPFSYYTPKYVYVFQVVFFPAAPSTTTIYSPVLSPVYATCSIHKVCAVWNLELHLLVFVAVVSKISVQSHLLHFECYKQPIISQARKTTKV
jgi:hypothetical protein